MPDSGADVASRARDYARAIYDAAVDAVRADTLVRRKVQRSGDRLQIENETVELGSFRRILVVGAGKASAPMAAAIEEVLGDRLTDGLVVTKDGHALPTKRIEVVEAAHPVPDDRSIEAGRQIVELVGRAEADTLVICLLSGGASALMELPEEGIPLADLQTTTSLLLKAGAPIEELNAVRACLSRIKAGGLARAAGEATVLCLALSDVLGNSLEVIGSGPCLISERSRRRALDILAKRGLIGLLPSNVIELLRTTEAQLEQPSKGKVFHFILCDLWTALDAAKASAISRGLKPAVLTGWLQGEAREVGGVFGALARDMAKAREETEIDCYIAGGETTVTVRGEGKGGRSQELAAAAALGMRGTPGVALLAAGTDGTDGPTDATGAIVDGETAEIAKSAGYPLAQALRENDCYPALNAAGALLRTGPTNTNVGDLVIVVQGG